MLILLSIIPIGETLALPLPYIWAKEKSNKFFDKFPNEFCRKYYLIVSNKSGFPDKTTEKTYKMLCSH
jgi:hypothetical protein